MTTQLFNRKVSVVVYSSAMSAETPTEGESREWTELDVKFKVKHTKDCKPNEGSVDIYNLSPDSINFIQTRGERIALSVGYGGILDTIFIGDISFVDVKKQGQEIVTVIRARDGGSAYLQSRINVTLGPGSTVSDALRELSTALDTYTGSTVVDAAAVARQYQTGITMVGSVRHYLDLIAEEVGATWWIQEGVLNFVTDGEPTDPDAILVTPDTGLVKSPLRKIKNNRRGRVKIEGVKWTMLIQPFIRPGRIADIRTRFINGQYLIEEVNFTGSSGADLPFYAEMTGKAR